MTDSEWIAVVTLGVPGIFFALFFGFALFDAARYWLRKRRG